MKNAKHVADSEGLGLWGNQGFTVGYVDEAIEEDAEAREKPREETQ